MEKEIKYSVRQFFDYHFEYNVGTGLSKKKAELLLEKKNSIERCYVHFDVIEEKKGEINCKYMKCLNCKKPIVPDKEALNFITKEWDGHTLKFTCKCVPKKIRISKG